DRVGRRRGLRHQRRARLRGGALAARRGARARLRRRSQGMDRLRGRRARAAAGFTLIEVMIALGMLAAGLLTVAVAQLYAMQGGTSGRHASEAATVAHSWIENLQRRSFDDPELEETGGLWTEEVEVPATIQ